MHTSRKLHVTSLVGIGLVLLLGVGVAAEVRQYNPKDFPRFELTPSVRQIFDDGGHRAKMAYNYLRYATALVAGGDALDAVVASDIVLNDLQPMGFSGLTGLKEFRRQRNAAMTYDRALLLRVDVPSNDITDVELCTERTDPSNSTKAVFVIHARDRWIGDKVVERWHRAEPQPSAKGCDDLVTATQSSRTP
jgi:hypothetical protein